MPLSSFARLFEAANARAVPVALAAAGGDDATVLEALRVACDRGWVAPTLVGPEAAMREAAAASGVDLHGFRLVDAPPEAIAVAAVAEVRQGRARLLLKGKVNTPTLLRAVLDADRGLRTGRLISQFVLMEVVRDDRRFLMADTGICIRPGPLEVVEILESGVELARALGADRPRVALLSATETPTSAMPETLEAAALEGRNRAGEFPACLVQGPLSFDLAYASDSARKKGVAGDVAGAADLMIFPSLVAANLTVKAIMYTADCRFGGVLRGTTAPVVFMSRADSADTRLRSLAIALALVDPATPP